MSDRPRTVAVLRESEWADVWRNHDAAELLSTAEYVYRQAVLAPGGDRAAGLEHAAWAVAVLLCEWRVWVDPTATGPPTPGL